MLTVTPRGLLKHAHGVKKHGFLRLGGVVRCQGANCQYQDQVREIWRLVPGTWSPWNLASGAWSQVPRLGCQDPGARSQAPRCQSQVLGVRCKVPGTRYQRWQGTRCLAPSAWHLAPLNFGGQKRSELPLAPGGGSKCQRTTRFVPPAEKHEIGGPLKNDTCGVRTHALADWRLEPAP